MIQFDFSFNFGPSFITSLIIFALLAIFFIIMGIRFSRLDARRDDVPTKGLMFLCVVLVDYFNKSTDDNLGRDKRGMFAPFFIGLLSWLLLGNIASIFGLTPPVSNLGVALSMSVIAFLIFQVSAIKYAGIKAKLKGLIGPVPLAAPIILPINLIGEFTTPFSMGMRLFGNIFSGVLLSGVLFGAISGLEYYLQAVIALPFIAMIFHPIFDIAFGLIQVYVFFMITTMNIKLNIE